MPRAAPEATHYTARNGRPRREYGGFGLFKDHRASPQGCSRRPWRGAALRWTSRSTPKMDLGRTADPRAAHPQGNQWYVQELSTREARTRTQLITRVARRSAAAWRQGCLLGASDGRDARATGGPGAPAAKSRPNQSPSSPSKRSRTGRRRQSRPRCDRAIPVYFQGRCGAEHSGQRTAARVATVRVA